MNTSPDLGYVLCVLRDSFNPLANYSAQEVPCELHKNPLIGKDRWKAELPLLKIYYILQTLKNICALSIPIHSM